MAVKKLKDDKGTEYEVEVDDDDDDDDGPFIDENDLKGLFDKWLGERESSNQTKQDPPTTQKKRKAVRIKSTQKPPTTTEQEKPRRLRLA